MILLTSEESPSKGGAMNFYAISDDSALADRAASPSQSIAKDGEEDHGCDYTLEGKEVLDLKR